DSGIAMPLPTGVRRVVHSIALPWMAFTLIVYLFALAGGGLGWRGGIYVFGAPQAGMLVREVGGMKSIATLTALVNAAGSGRQAWEARWTQSVPLSAHWTLVAEWSRLWQDSGSTRAREAWSVHIKQVF
ncbi:MAG: hypothetical protein ACK4MG_10755, partial [Aquabacterium sp.]